MLSQGSGGAHEGGASCHHIVDDEDAASERWTSPAEGICQIVESIGPPQTYLLNGGCGSDQVEWMRCCQSLAEWPCQQF